ncbi:MAG: serine/threonine-protein kinase [Polyangiaceae bacterium]
MTRLDQDVLIAGRFRLTRELGRGGMGSVWLAHHVALDVPCAVKFIAEASASDAVFRNRFEREARAVARLRHPNVVQVYDTGVWEDLPYIAMELLEGEALGERMARLGKLDLGATAAIVTQVAAALQRAAQLGIVHRDLKPENIFLARQGAGETVKLLDFGIAKLHHEADRGPVTVTGAFVGTPQYMSPEHAHGGKEIDPRSDLWSLAVVTYECVTGRLPFDGTGLGEVLQAIMSAPIPVPSAIEPALQGAFDGWWARAAAREPAERFQTAADLAAALELVARVPAGAPAGGAVQRAGADTVQAAAADTVQAAAAACHRACGHAVRRRARHCRFTQPQPGGDRGAGRGGGAAGGGSMARAARGDTVEGGPPRRR